MVNDTLNFFKVKANRISNWQKVSKSSLLNSYIEHEHDELGECYLAAVICRYWSIIYTYYNKNKNFELEDYIAWLIEAVLKAISYRGWVDKTKAISKDPDGAEKVVNRCITTVIGNHYYLSGMDKRKLNSDEGNRLSLDYMLDDTNSTLHDLLPSLTNNGIISYCGELVQKYIDKKDYVSAVALDTICFQDSFKDSQFNMRKVVNQLTERTDSYINYFIGSYDNVSKKDLAKAYAYIDSITMPAKKNNNKLYDVITKLLDNLKEDKFIKEFLCC